MLQFVVWNDAYSVRSPRLDEHHKRILRLVNELHGKFHDGVQAGDLKAMLGQLVSYTNIHFAYEQYLMQLAGYKDVSVHVAVHNRMIARTSYLHARYTYDTESLSREVFDFLKDWWTSHIGVDDARYAPTVSALDMSQLR